MYCASGVQINGYRAQMLCRGSDLCAFCEHSHTRPDTEPSPAHRRAWRNIPLRSAAAASIAGHEPREKTNEQEEKEPALSVRRGRYLSHAAAIARLERNGRRGIPEVEELVTIPIDARPVPGARRHAGKRQRLAGNGGRVL